MKKGKRNIKRLSREANIENLELIKLYAATTMDIRDFDKYQKYIMHSYMVSNRFIQYLKDDESLSLDGDLVLEIVEKMGYAVEHMKYVLALLPEISDSLNSLFNDILRHQGCTDEMLKNERSGCR